LRWVGEADFHMRAVAKWFVGRMTATAQHGCFHFSRARRRYDDEVARNNVWPVALDDQEVWVFDHLT
jgi:hypothetical protein